MPRPRSDLRPRIIEAARTCFSTQGVDGASLRAIARDAETSIGMVYYYFPTKDDLFAAVVEDVYANLLKDIQAIVEADGTFGERLRKVSARLGGMTDSELTVVQLVIRENLLSPERRMRIIERFERGHMGLLRQEIQRAIDAGEISNRYPLPVLMPAVLGVMMIPQVIFRALGLDSPLLAGMLPGAEPLSQMLVEILFGGLVSSPDRARVTGNNTSR
jgi:AcrR family transcriptional regulator